tara:strand:- start:294 stop:467 length:174 start_codon:yes stop_codon:yes gene_type:complete
VDNVVSIKVGEKEKKDVVVHEKNVENLEKARNQKHIAVKILRLEKPVKITIANVGNV